MPSYIFEEYSDIPWAKISGLRNKIVHDYGAIQLDILYDTIKNDLPNLKEEIDSILQ